jgi:hypothetical protein
LTRPDPGALPQAGIVRAVGARDSIVAKKTTNKTFVITDFIDVCAAWMYQSLHLPESVLVRVIRGVYLFRSFAIIYVRAYKSCWNGFFAEHTMQFGSAGSPSHLLKLSRACSRRKPIEKKQSAKYQRFFVPTCSKIAFDDPKKINVMPLIGSRDWSKKGRVPKTRWPIFPIRKI